MNDKSKKDIKSKTDNKIDIVALDTYKYQSKKINIYHPDNLNQSRFKNSL